MRSSWSVVVAIAVLCVGVAGCKSDASPSPLGHAAGGGGDPDAGPPMCLRHPPGRPDGAVAGADELVLAMMRLSLGDITSTGAPDSSAWRHLGYDLDGIGIGDKPADHCRPATGECGIDNAFGASFSGFIVASTDANDHLAAGSLPALVFRLRGLDAQAPASATAASVVLAEALDGPPAWDGNDSFGAHTESLHDGDLEQPLLQLPASYSTNGVWVSGPIANISIPLPILADAGVGEGRSLLLPLRNAVVTMKLSGSGGSEGTIAGVVMPDELVDAAIIHQIGRTEPELCGHANIYESFRMAADIDSTGGGECDAISVGLGFEARAVRLVDVLPAQPPIVPCEGWVE